MNRFSNPLLEKQDAYEAARSMLSKQDDHSLRYAALELRRCLEAIVYEKLSVYSDLLPEASVHQWQPAKAFDALLAIEPRAEQSFSFAIGLQKDATTPSVGPLFALGVDERPNAEWIKAKWHKLGAYLHAEWPFSQAGKEISSARPALEALLEEVKPFATSHFSMAMKQPIDFCCLCCKTKVHVMRSAVEKGFPSICLTCGTQYRAVAVEGEFDFFQRKRDSNVTAGDLATFRNGN